MMEAGLPLVILQPGAIYGPGDTSQLGGVFGDWLAGKPLALPLETTLCWSHVDDVARAHVLAMERGVPGQTYIVAGSCHTLHEAFDIAARVTGRKAPRLWIPPGALRATAPVVGVLERVLPVPERYRAESLRVMAGTTYAGNDAKVREALGYEPRSLEQGFRETFLERG
jgi:nucleoside-diphosphate-sugar epimerase